MADMQGYGQFCPIAITAEVLARRWTPLVLRALCLGATRFNDIQDGVPRMSPALLSKRLKELEHAGVLVRDASASGKGAEYRLTEAGRALFPVLEAMGFWAQVWLRREITADRNLDPDVLMCELRRTAPRELPDGRPRRVAAFWLEGVPAERRRYWLVFEADAVDVCTRDPGHEVDLFVTAHIRTLVELWVGHRSIAAARADGSLRLDGSRAECDAFGRWFVRSHFASAGQAPARGRDGVPRASTR